MKKIVVTLMTLLVANQAMASDLPGRLICKPINATAVGNFKIYDIGGEHPRSTFSDASFMDKTENSRTVSVGWSNECDNSYSVTFKTKDLENLRSGEWIKGKLEYFNSELLDNEQVESETVTIVCTK